MKQGDRIIGSDVGELMRMIGRNTTGVELELESWLESCYDEIWKEGYREGRLAQMTGGEQTRPRSPYR